MTQIDTSGAVQATNQDDDVCRIVWHDLLRFTQGYIEAVFASEWANGRDLNAHHLGFSDLAPETLARIIADCEAVEKMSAPDVLEKHGKTAGATFWTQRQVEGAYERFPPLTVQLGEDGKVRLA